MTKPPPVTKTLFVRGLRQPAAIWGGLPVSYSLGGLFRLVLVVGLMLGSMATTKGEAHAMDIQVVKSDSGVEAWLVEERSVPLVAMRFAFEGGSSQDPLGKEGLANFMTTMLDEGAGPYDATAFQKLMEENATRLSFSESRDHFSGSFETLTENRDEAIRLLKLALTEPRLDADAIERMRGQLLARLAFDAKDPNRVADDAWSALAFPDHPYGRPSSGTVESVTSISREDLDSYRSRIFARDNLKVAVVGDIDAPTLKKILDDVFGGLPERANLAPVPPASMQTGKQVVVRMPVPQSVAMFGLPAVSQEDPDFFPAFVMNQILGGGGFASRLMNEVREKRGLAYSVYSYLHTMENGAILGGGVATKNERVKESLDVIRNELKRMADEGPTETELANSKSYLTGAYALRFDSNGKIARQLLGIQLDDLGIDYIQTRNQNIEAVTLDDVRRVAKRLLDVDDLVITIVGQPEGIPG